MMLKIVNINGHKNWSRSRSRSWLKCRFKNYSWCSLFGIWSISSCWSSSVSWSSSWKWSFIFNKEDGV